MATSLQPRLPGPLTGLGPLPSLGIHSSTGETSSQSRRRKKQDVEDRLSTLEGVVAQLSNANLEANREVDSLRERLQLLEKVFMFVDFDKLQRVVDKLGTQHVESNNEKCPFRARIDGGVRHDAPASFIDNFSAFSVLSGTSSEEQLKVIDEVGSSKLSFQDHARDSPGFSDRDEVENVELHKAGEILSQSNLSEDEEAKPVIGMPRSKSSALRSAMAAKGSAVWKESAMTVSSRHVDSSQHVEYASVAGADTVATIHQPRSKCYEFAENYRRRYGPESELPSFIYERLGQDGMSKDEINSIGNNVAMTSQCPALSKWS